MSAAELGNVIFLSYRRADTAAHALALRLELETQLRAAQIFMDTHTIQGGDNWPLEIENALSTAKVVVALFGRAWGMSGPDGQRRIDDPADWVHRELAFALHRNAQIVPILADNAAALRQADLPAPLKPLADRQALRLRIGEWDSDMQGVVAFLKQAGFESKKEDYRFPTPHPLIEKTVPVPWPVLESAVRDHLRNWRIEFRDDPARLHYKRVELARDFQFRSFKAAMEFVDFVAAHAKQVDHHPRWMNLWRTVTIWLSTWDAGHRVTALDLEFARVLERKFRDF